MIPISIKEYTIVMETKGLGLGATRTASPILPPNP